MEKSHFVGITVPHDLYEKIKKEQEDLPRSYFYRKLIKIGLRQTGISKNES